MLRYYIALWAAKFSVLALKITKHAGTNFPGIIALRICPNFLKYAAKPERIIAVTGTNGKTTSANMILDMLTLEGFDVLNNKEGSNIASGISTSLIYGMTFFGKCKHKVGVFEVDERSAKRVYPYLKPQYMLITNLSRDSIMRNAHPEYIANFLSENIPPETKLVLNADDLISGRVALNNERVYFGIDRMDGDRRDCINLINDFQICPECNTKLEYEYLRYNHIGKAYCPHCGFKAPEYDFRGINCDIDNMTIEVEDNAGKGKYRLLNDSVFNIYNLVSVVSLFRKMGYEHSKIEELMSKINIVGSRFEEEKFKDKTLFRLLAKEKNAFATTRVFDYISTMPGDKEIILMNSCQGDMKHWSENTCWLYDCDFEFLANDSIKHIIVCGPRRFDHKLRLKLAGYKGEISFVEKEIEAPEKLRLFKNDNIYVLYGTDSLNLGMKVADKVAAILDKCGEGGENAPSYAVEYAEVNNTGGQNGGIKSNNETQNAGDPKKEESGKSIRVEVLFPEIANLYGDLGNIAYIKRSSANIEVVEDHLTDEPHFVTETPDLIYMGTLTEHGQELAKEKLAQYLDKLVEMMDEGVHFLFTGNALEVLGSDVIDETNGKEKVVFTGLNIYPVNARRDMMKRFNSLYLGTFSPEPSGVVFNSGLADSVDDSDYADGDTDFVVENNTQDNKQSIDTNTVETIENESDKAKSVQSDFTSEFTNGGTVKDETTKVELNETEASESEKESITIVGYKSQFTHGYWLGSGKFTCVPDSGYMFISDRGPGLNPDIVQEGIRLNNFMATYVIGPVLVLNPLFTKWLLGELGAENVKLAFEDEAMEAYEKRVEEYSNPNTGFYY